MELGEYPAIAHRLTSYWGNWPLSRPLSVGDIGVVRDGAFLRETSLARIAELPRTPVRVTRSDVKEQFYEKTSTSLQVGAVASMNPAPTVAGGDARVTVEFATGKSALIAMSGATYRQVDDIPTLRAQVLALLAEKVWEREWVLITETVEASGVTVLVSADDGASVQIRLRASGGAFQVWQLADAGLCAGVEARRGIGMEAIAETGVPLYRTLRVRRNWVGQSRVALTGDEPISDEAFEAVPLPPAER